MLPTSSDFRPRSIACPLIGCHFAWHVRAPQLALRPAIIHHRPHINHLPPITDSSHRASYVAARYCTPVASLSEAHYTARARHRPLKDGIVTVGHIARPPSTSQDVCGTTSGARRQLDQALSGQRPSQWYAQSPLVAGRITQGVLAPAHAIVDASCACALPLGLASVNASLYSHILCCAFSGGSGAGAGLLG